MVRMSSDSYHFRVGGAFCITLCHLRSNFLLSLIELYNVPAFSPTYAPLSEQNSSGEGSSEQTWGWSQQSRQFCRTPIDLDRDNFLAYSLWLFKIGVGAEFLLAAFVFTSSLVLVV